MLSNAKGFANMSNDSWLPRAIAKPLVAVEGSFLVFGDLFLE